MLNALISLRDYIFTLIVGHLTFLVTYLYTLGDPTAELEPPPYKVEHLSLTFVSSILKEVRDVENIEISFFLIFKKHILYVGAFILL